jgi:hypothetical protein
MDTTVFSIIISQGLVRGTVIQSLAGHDRMKPYIVIRTEGCFVYLADGGLRPLEKPKKKRVSHIRPLGLLQDAKALDNIEALGDGGQQNSCLRQLLNEFLHANLPKEEI